MNPSSSSSAGSGSRGQLGRIAPAGRERLEHRPQPVAVSSGLRPQPLAQVVAEDQVPTAEDLRGEKLRQAAIGVCRPRRLGAMNQVVDVAVQDEQAGRCRKNKDRQVPGPRPDTTPADAPPGWPAWPPGGTGNRAGR